MVTKRAKKTRVLPIPGLHASEPAKPHRPTPITPTAPPAGPVETVFSELLGELVPNYAAGAVHVPIDVSEAAGLRNGMSPDQVNAAIHAVITAKR